MGHSNADMFVLRIIIALAWSLYGPSLYVFLKKREKKLLRAGYLSICHSEAARETGVISCPENRKNGKALGTWELGYMTLFSLPVFNAVWNKRANITMAK